MNTVTLLGRRSKGKGKGIRARDRPLSRAQFPLPLLTPGTQARIQSNLSESTTTTLGTEESGRSG